MGRTLYFECNSGISGDMTVAALLDLGADEGILRKALDSMPLTGFEIEISRVKKAGLEVCDFNVKLCGEHENHDHDMEYLHGHENNGGHDYHDGNVQNNEHKHNHGHGRHHGHEHNSEHGHHHIHEHRGMPEIRGIIEQTDMSAGAKKTALKIFEILARAEAKAHGTSVDKVHFHEVGAVDSIVDIVAAAVCIDNLEVTEVIVPYLCEGRGTVRCQHGILPIPVPAVANIVQMNCLPLRLIDVYGELVTPTGAAIVAAIKSKDRLPGQFIINRIGMGAGKRNYERPSILRIMQIHTEPEKIEDRIYKLEANIDDCTGEMLGHAMERLFENGAADVSYMPVFMKKNRPAYLLTVICTEEAADRLESIIFRETTTIGIRKIKMERTVLERNIESILLPVGEMKAKRCVLPDGTVRKYPEYETVAELAGKTGKSMQEIMKLFYQAAGE